MSGMSFYNPTVSRDGSLIVMDASMLNYKRESHVSFIQRSKEVSGLTYNMSDSRGSHAGEFSMEEATKVADTETAEIKIKSEIISH